MKKLIDMKPGEALHLSSGRSLRLESVTPVTNGVMLTFNLIPARKGATPK